MRILPTDRHPETRRHSWDACTIPIRNNRVVCSQCQKVCKIRDLKSLGKRRSCPGNAKRPYRGSRTYNGISHK